MKLKHLLKEAKQVGVIYHYTHVGALQDILKSDELNTGVGNQPYISCTRNKNFHKTPRHGLADGKGINCVIILDGNKLSNKYKIGPYNFFANGLDDTYKDDDDIDEDEEAIWTEEIPNISKYIIAIAPAINNYRTIEIVNELGSQYNIPVKII